jgi:hypothetical protein
LIWVKAPKSGLRLPNRLDRDGSGFPCNKGRTTSTSTDSLSGPPICFKTVSLTKAGGETHFRENFVETVFLSFATKSRR